MKKLFGTVKKVHKKKMITIERHRRLRESTRLREEEEKRQNTKGGGKKKGKEFRDPSFGKGRGGHEGGDTSAFALLNSVPYNTPRDFFKKKGKATTKKASKKIKEIKQWYSSLVKREIQGDKIREKDYDALIQVYVTLANNSDEEEKQQEDEDETKDDESE